MQRLLNALCGVIISVSIHGQAKADPAVHNVILFVPDGLRSGVVNRRVAPTFAAVRDQGVAFKNSHALFPTFTTANASAMATGHYLGDTGDFANTLFIGFPVPAAGGSVTPYLENDLVIGDIDRRFAGNYLDEVTLLQAAREAGYNTASVGKVGPALIHDHTERSGLQTVVIDDSTGSKNGIPVAPWVADALKAAGLPAAAPSRADNGKSGDSRIPGTTVANVVQQTYFADVLTRIVLPRFAHDGKPFAVVFWSRDPDGTQHNQGDSLNAFVPGINGPTSLAAIRNADENLRRIRGSVTDLGLENTTDIFVTADHGFATISKQSHTSRAAKASYVDVMPGFLPPGFLAIDLSEALAVPLWDPDQGNTRITAGRHPKATSGLLGIDPTRPTVVIAGNGGSDLIYFVEPLDKALLSKVLGMLLAQDYVSGLFVADSLGRFSGALPLSAINLEGSAVTPTPSIVVNFRSFSAGCRRVLDCTIEIADTPLQQGQGMHGSFSRAETRNFMAAIGPDFKKAFIDTAPVSNADVGQTLAQILRLNIPSVGKLRGRVLTEAMPGGAMPRYTSHTLSSEADPSGLQTILEYQLVGTTRYFDAAGFPGRTVGLRSTSSASSASSAR